MSRENYKCLTFDIKRPDTLMLKTCERNNTTQEWHLDEALMPATLSWDEEEVEKL